MSNKEPCDPKCYTKGKGCILSTNGQCLHIFKNGEVSQPYKSNKSYYLEKYKFDNLYYKGVKVIFDEQRKSKN